MGEGEVLASVLRGHERDPGPSALALRLMGGVHRLVLSGDAPQLAAHYPSAGGEPHGPWPAFLDTVSEHTEELRGLLERPVQTNETARCAALLGAFLEVARASGLPLRLLEAGASAGLNLRFDHYRYELGHERWGRPDSPVVIRARLDGTPPLETPIEVAARAGCDARPVDPTGEEGRLTLASYVWADQRERFARLRAACAVAAEVPASLERAGAAAWTEARLAEQVAGCATVVFHSVVMQYLTDAERGRFEAALHEAGARAHERAPLARLAMEAADDLTDVRLTYWPGGEERLCARAGYHGDPVEWLSSPRSP